MTDLHYQISGNGEPIILIHGGGTDSRIWNNINLNVSNNFKIVSYDLRGHGQSPIPINTTNHVQDLLHLLKGLQIEKASLVGHSLGGQIATDFTILYPKMVHKLILLSPGLTGYPYGQAYKKMGEKIWNAVPNVDSMLEIMLQTPDAYAMQITMKSNQANTIKQIHRDNIIKSLEWKNFEQRWPTTNTEKRLTELTTPILFALGSEDKPDMFKIKQLYQVAPNIQFREVKGADHGLINTNPNDVCRLILDFIR